MSDIPKWQCDCIHAPEQHYINGCGCEVYGCGCTDFITKCILCGKGAAYPGARYCGAACCHRWERGERPWKEQP